MLKLQLGLLLATAWRCEFGIGAIAKKQLDHSHGTVLILLALAHIPIAVG